MSGTLLDQLTVKVGLDPSDFKKGAAEASKAMEELKGQSKDTGSSMGDALSSGAKKATNSLGTLGSMLGKGGAIGVGIGAAIFIGKKLDDALFKVAVSLRQVSIESKNVGLSAAGLRNLQNASELAGGSLEDAAQTVGDLQKSLFNLRFNGQVSEQIVMLSRLGVQFQDSYGRARDFNDVMLDTADALEKAQQRGEMTRPEAFFTAQQAGFTGGMAQLVLSGRAGVQAELDKQRARTQVNQGMTQGANDWVRSSLSLGQATVAELGNKGVGAVGTTRAEADRALENAGKYTMDMLTDAGDKLTQAVNILTDYLKSLFGGGKTSSADARAAAIANPVGRGGTAMRGESAWHSTIAAAAKRNGVPEEILSGIIRQESSYNPSVPVSSTGAVGIAQLQPTTAKELGITPGVNPAADIDAAARYLRKQKDYASTHGYEGNMAWVAATAAYTAGMGNTMSGEHIGPKSAAYPGNVLRGTPYAEDVAHFQFGPEGHSVHTDVQIDSITVNTQATDAEGIAGAVGPAMRRKLLTDQAEGGYN